jgi:hypothetical protein
MNQIPEHKPLCFYSIDYSLVLNFNESEGNLSGKFSLSSQYGSTVFPFKSIYSEDDSIKFAFSLEWSFSTKENYGFTMFSGQILNPNVLILDWLLVGSDVEDYSVKGTDFLYSSIHYDDYGKKTPISVKPFPIDFARHIESIQ